MKIAIIGGGPAGLYFGLLMKKSYPRIDVAVYERNRAEDTFGWGVVFSDETLEQFRHADEDSYRTIVDSFRSWQDIEVYRGDERAVSRGHGFSALSRHTLLRILQQRCGQQGIELFFEHTIEDLESSELAGADLIVAADGVNSFVRERLADKFVPHVDWRKCRFCWLGTDKPLEAFTFLFEQSEFGLFQVHAYPFEERLGTFIVECREEVWRAAGLDQASEEQTVEFCERLFGRFLDGHRLFANRSLWRAFPTVQNETWHHGNVVLLGDAAHTAHFSIGSGTKLAMEDAIALAEQFRLRGLNNVSEVLASYEQDRWVDVLKLQKAAQTSLEWFENSARYQDQSVLQLTFNLMTRSKRITYDNLRRRDPQLVEDLDAELCAARRDVTPVRPPIFMPFELRGLELQNRVVVSPMCQYSAIDGIPGDWHLVHLGARATGGAGLVMTEMTDVSPEGRITLGCTGLYNRQQLEGWRRIVEFVHQHSPAKIGIQLAHAGRKGSACHPWEGEDVPLPPDSGGWPTIAPSALAFGPGWPRPRAMTRDDMNAIVAAFVRSTRLADRAGFDLVELHMAHGYLLSSFLSPLTNIRTDRYGGSLANRLRFPLEVFSACRKVWPAEKPMSVRISSTDWMADGSGMTGDAAVEIAAALQRAGCDLIDVSSGGNVLDSSVLYGRMYQVPWADRIRHEVGVPVMAVGALVTADHANTVIASGRADLAAMARPHLRDPALTLHAAEDYEYWDAEWPQQYLAAKPRPSKPSGRRERYLRLSYE